MRLDSKLKIPLIFSQDLATSGELDNGKIDELFGLKQQVNRNTKAYDLVYTSESSIGIPFVQFKYQNIRDYLLDHVNLRIRKNLENSKESGSLDFSDLTEIQRQMYFDADSSTLTSSLQIKPEVFFNSSQVKAILEISLNYEICTRLILLFDTLSSKTEAEHISFSSAPISLDPKSMNFLQVNEYTSLVEKQFDTNDFGKGLFLVYVKGSFALVNDPESLSLSTSVLVSQTELSNISFLSGLTLIGIYTSTILVIAQIVLRLLNPSPNDVWINWVPRAQNLLKIIDAIEIARMENDFFFERKLFFFFLDILRSPELGRAANGSQVHLDRQ